MKRFYRIIGMIFMCVLAVGTFSSQIAAQEDVEYQEGEEVKRANMGPQITNAKVSGASNTGYTITFNAVDVDGIDVTNVVVWHDRQPYTKAKWYKGNKVGVNTYQVRIESKDFNYMEGNFNTKIYAYDKYSLRSEYTFPKQVMSNLAPQISNVKITNKSNKGYTVTFDAIDNDGLVGVTNVVVWHESQTYETAKWYKGVKIGANTYQVKVDSKDLKVKEGNFNTKIYAYDNRSKRGENVIALQTIENQTPIVKNAYITNKKSTQFTVEFEAYDPDGSVDVTNVVVYNENQTIQQAYWFKPEKIGNKYRFVVNQNAIGNVDGNYIVKVFVYDNNSRRGEMDLAKQTLKNPAPIISNARVYDITNTGYTVAFSASDDVKVGVTNVVAWTTLNGEDDLVWGKPYYYNGSYCYRVKIRDHKFASGDYETKIYAYDNYGKRGEYTLDVLNMNASIKSYSQTQLPWGGYTYGKYPFAATGCAPTALSTIFSVYQEDIKPNVIANYLWMETKEFNKSFMGTSGLGVRYAIQKFGFTARGINTYQGLVSELNSGRPVYFPIKYGSSTHALIISDYYNGNVYVRDPMKGKMTGWYSVKYMWEQRSNNKEDLRGGYVGYAVIK